MTSKAKYILNIIVLIMALGGLRSCGAYDARKVSEQYGQPWQNSTYNTSDTTSASQATESIPAK